MHYIRTKQREMDIIDSLNWRYAVKKFDTKKLEENTVNEIIDAGLLTATSYGLQAYKVIVVKDEAIREQLIEHSWGQRQVKDASHLLVIASQKDVTNEEVDQYVDLISETRSISKENITGYGKFMSDTIGKMPSDIKTTWLNKQTYIVLGTMMTACAIKGVDSCPMEGFNADEYDRILGLDKLGLRSCVLLPIGYRSEEDDTQHLAKVRKPKSDMIIEL